MFFINEEKIKLPNWKKSLIRYFCAKNTEMIEKSYRLFDN